MAPDLAVEAASGHKDGFKVAAIADASRPRRSTSKRLVTKG
jgi:hypothetical protein